MSPRHPLSCCHSVFWRWAPSSSWIFCGEWQHRVWSAGYLGMHWPKEYGGQGADPAYQSVVDRELGAANAPIMFNTIGLGWVGPLLLEMGTEDEKAKYLKAILSGEEIWCQGFFQSLITARTLAPFRPALFAMAMSMSLMDPKIWTTMGNYADHMILLARTDPNRRAQNTTDCRSFYRL